MKNSLGKNGLSMSEAQTISNICNQKALDIQNRLSTINNYSKTVKIGDETYSTLEGVPMPENITELVLEKAALHATQAFLMENIKAKDALINSIINEPFVYDVEAPILGDLVSTNLLPTVDESWGLSQLSLEEVNTLLKQEAIAAHVGQFIHKNSKLDNLRSQINNISTLEWMEVETGKKVPVKVNVHHTADKLAEVHENFASLHRTAEKEVNFFKAKIKNLVTEENARISNVNAMEIARVSKINSELREEHTNALKAWGEAKNEAQAKFEESKNNRTKEAAALKIKTAAPFQETVDKILSILNK